MFVLKVLKKLVRGTRRIFAKIRVKLYLRKCKEKGSNVGLCFPLTIEGRHNVSIGNNSAIGTYCHIWGAGGVKIGNNVTIGAHSCITSQWHNDYESSPEREAIHKEVVIEDHVRLAYNVVILPGITIGRGAVIGAGAVCRKSIPPYAIVAGNPAKIVGFKFLPHEIIEHEKSIYSESGRLPLDLLEHNYNKYFVKKMEEIRKYVQ
jgi:acetyltransferase-like isoleucine patch superfamily enzyme